MSRRLFGGHTRLRFTRMRAGGFTRATVRFACPNAAAWIHFVCEVR